MSRRWFRASCLVVAVLVVSAAPASADGDARRRGDCVGGPGDYELRVGRVDRTTLRIRFRIDDVDPGDAWQIFVSDNGVRVVSRTKTSNAEGQVRIRRRIRDRAGTDRVVASGLNVVDGTTCRGTVRFGG